MTNESYDRELIARMLADYATFAKTKFQLGPVWAQIEALRAADDADATGVHTARIAPAEAKGDECPNCVSPWKCNGPHIGEAPDYGYDTPQPPAGEAVARDREADRARFADAAFNNWLDEGISDSGHTVWDAVGDVSTAWSGWCAREFYGMPPVADCVAPEEIYIRDGDAAACI